jgi:hypothetical protein
MSLTSLILNALIKKLESEYPELAAKVKAFEAFIAPIWAQANQAAIATAIASLSGGKLTAVEVQALETELGVILGDIATGIAENT